MGALLLVELSGERAAGPKSLNLIKEDNPGVNHAVREKAMTRDKDARRGASENVDLFFTFSCISSRARSFF